MANAARSSLEAAVRRALDLHPFGRSGAIAEGSGRVRDGIQAIWATALETHGARRQTFLDSLSKTERRLLLAGVRTRLDDKAAVQVLDDVYRKDWDERQPSIGYLLFLTESGREPYRRYLAQLGPLPAGSPIDASWFGAVDPLESILSTYLRGKQGFDEYFRVQFGALDGNARLRRVLLVRLFNGPHLGAAYAREGGKWLGEVVETGEVEIAHWYRVFLIATSKQGWPKSCPLMRQILRAHGDPEERGKYWQSLPEPVWRAVRAWKLEGDLDRFFTSDGDQGRRLRFWRRFLQEMTAVLPAGENDALLICFQGCFAVQFREMGRATYGFKKGALARTLDLTSTALYRFVLDRSDIALIRYTHQGHFWEAEAEAQVRAMLRVVDA